jgi:hypothetical protein
MEQSGFRRDQQQACQTEPNGAACLDALRNIRNPYWIGDPPADTEVSGWLDAGAERIRAEGAKRGRRCRRDTRHA